MNEDGALFDARFDDGGPFRDTPEPGGISLESALRDFGPAALDDLIPRIRVLARALDAAHGRGVVHGALNPSKIIITDEGTSIIRGESSYAPYIAPEVASGERPTAASDQFSLAAITYEWLFGKRIDGPAHRAIAVKAMPEVDRAVMAKAFTRALANTPEVRFPSCTDFCNAVAAAGVPELPLATGADDHEDDTDPVGPFVPENPGDEELPVALMDDDRAAPNIDDVKIVAEETNLTAAQPDFDAILPVASPAEARRPIESGVPSWNPSSSSSRESTGFSGAALIIAAIVGAVFGFAGGYMARPRALQQGPAETFATQPDGGKPAASASNDTALKDTALKGTASKDAPKDTSLMDAVSKLKEAEAKRAETAPAPNVAANASKDRGRLLVRSEPSGATVTVDGVEKGVTPLTLRDVEFGTRNLTIAHRGYVTETRRVAITSSRASRSLDVKMAAEPVAPRRSESATPPRPSTPASLGKSAPAAEGRSGATGGVIVDSRPPGASVTINGKPSGTTPLTVDDLPPGDYRIVMTMPGFRNFAATVRVVAGERVRAAYSLTAQEQE